MQVGPYRTLDELGRGGMGVVYRAEDAEGQVVALKVLLPQRAAEPRVRQRFLHELRSLSRLRHPHLVRLLAAGEHEGAPWLALEFVDGPSLEGRLREGPLGVDPARRLVAQLASALAYLHDCGVIHRDLKPDNVLLRGEHALLTDFGLVLDDEDFAATRLSATGAFLGTPGYWAPEQARGEKHEQGPHTDLYGLGAVLYACLLGRPPVVAETFAEYLQTQRFQGIRAPHVERAEVPRWLSALCLECLDPDPARRPASANEVARRLQQGADSGAEAAAGASTRRLGWVLLGAVLVAGASAGLTASLLLGGGEAPDAQEQVRAPESRGEPWEARSPELVEVESLLRTEDFAPALAKVEAYLERDPDSPLAHVLLARALLGSGDKPGARGAVDRALELDPDSAWAYYLRGRMRAQAGESAAALDDLRRARELDPELVAPWVVAGGMLATAGRYAEALPLFERALELAPRDPRIRRYHGLALLNLERPAEALESLEVCLAAEPDDVLTRANRAMAYARLGRWTEALEEIDWCLLRQARDVPLLRLRGEVLASLDRVPEALVSYGRALEVDPADGKTLALRGEAYFRLERFREALADYQASLGIDPGVPSAWHNVGLASFRLGRHEEAREAFDEALRLDPDSLTSRAARGVLRVKQGDLAGGLKDFDGVLERDPDHVEGLRMRGEVHSLLANYAQALRDLERALELEPEDPDLRTTYALNLFHVGRLDEAWAECQRAVAAQPDSVSARNLECVLARARGDRDGMRRAAAQAFAKGKGSRIGWRTAIYACETRADYEAALDQLARTVAALPADPPGWLHGLRGRCRLALGDLPGAQADFVRAREGSSAAEDVSRFATWEAMAHALAGDLSQARVAAERARVAVVDQPSAWDPILWLAGFGDPEGLLHLESTVPGGLRGIDPVLAAFHRGPLPELEPTLAGCPGLFQRARVACFLGLAAERRGDPELARACYRYAAGYADRGVLCTVWSELRLAQLER